jgi:serine/threonine-protein kinase SRPK3
LPPEIDQLSDEQLYEKYGPPTTEPVVRFDGQKLPPGVPTHGTVPVWLGKPSDEVRLPEAKILLIDFGEAFEPAREEKYVSHTPLCTRPPEAHFEPSKPLSFPSDMWSLACAIWSILGQRPLFDPWLVNIDDVTRWQVDAFGILPPEWWLLWEDRGKWFDDNGVPLENREGVFSLEDRLRFSTQEPRQKEGMGLFEQDEEKALLARLRSMLRYEPGDRSTAGEVLGSEWMSKWAMPEYKKIL